MTRQNSFVQFPKAIWRDIIQDRMVSFERINEAFGRSFSLIGNEPVLVTEPLRTQAQWLRAYNAWEAAVLLVYPHRRSELDNYPEITLRMFTPVPDNPYLAILYDTHVRERYARRPYHIDDRSEHSISFIDMVLDARRAGYSAKRSSAFESSSAKRPKVVCVNWNYGKCHETPCRNQRMHDVCSECGGDH
jgi:hypothetical protein